MINLLVIGNKDNEEIIFEARNHSMAFKLYCILKDEGYEVKVKIPVQN